MKQGWEIKTLNQISENLDSKRVPITKNIRNNGTIPYYGASGIVDYVNDYLFDENLLLISEDGANLLARSYPIAFSISGKAWVNNHAHVVKFDKIDTQKFVELYFNSIKLDDFVSGMAQPKLNQSMLNKIPIPIPPLPEQQRIVAILDEAFEAMAKAKANAERNLQNAKELFQSELNSIFTNKGPGWEEKKLGEIAIVKGGKRVPKGYRFETKSTIYPYIRVTDFNDNGSVDLNDIHYINLEVYNQIKNYTISTKDLYISIAGTIGKTGIIPHELEGANLTENACKLVFKEGYDNHLVYYFTKSTYFLIQAGLNTRVSAMPKLALTRLSSIKLSLPISMNSQQYIVEKLDTLSLETKKLEEIYQKKIGDFEELKKSILNKAFEGEL